MRQYNSFEEWAAAQPKPPAPEPPPPAEPIIDPVEEWKRQGKERDQERAEATAMRKAVELREVREARQHELRLAKAAANGEVDWAELLNGIADAFGSINERLADLEARVDLLDGNKRNRSERKPNKSKNKPINDLETELIDLPRYMMPRRGYEIGWPLGSKIHYSHPLRTKTKQAEHK